MSIYLSKEIQLLVNLFGDQFVVGQPLTRNRTQNDTESLGISQDAIVEAECLLIKVSEKMLRVTGYVCSPQSTLEQAPKVFNAIRVDVPACVFCGMVDSLMDIFGLQTFIRFQGVSVEIRASLNILSKFWTTPTLTLLFCSLVLR